MNKMIASVTVLASVCMAGLVLAQATGQQSTVGTIKSLDSTNRMITLDDGTTYMAGEKANFDALKQGSLVRLSCDQRPTLCPTAPSVRQQEAK